MKPILVISFIVVLLTSCSDESQSCESSKTGFLKIINNTNFTMEVYYYVPSSYYDPVTLGPGQSTTFSDVPQGEVEPYAKGSFGDKWGTVTIYQCQTSQYVWDF